MGVTEIKAPRAAVICQTAFWVVILFFMAAATSSLELDFFSSWLNALLGYVPPILASVFIVITESTAEVSDLSQSVSLGSIDRFSIFFVALVVGIELFVINIQFITTFIIMIVGVKGILINITSTIL